MTYDPALHHRRSVRLPGYDYAQAGAYFLTTVIHSRENLLGNIQNDAMQLSPAGQIVQRAWLDLPKHYPHVVLDEFCVMPNHVHGIIVLTEDGRGGSIEGRSHGPDQILARNEIKPWTDKTRPYNDDHNVVIAPRHGLSEIVRAFKSFSAKRINMLRGASGTPVWQRNYYEHIIRNQAEMDDIRRYIFQNPLRWMLDQENPRRER